MGWMEWRWRGRKEDEMAWEKAKMEARVLGNGGGFLRRIPPRAKEGADCT